jgi:hypothetical protein
LFSRVTPEPTFLNYTSTNPRPDQLFGFVWEDMKVDKVEFDVDAPRSSARRRVTLGSKVLTNNSDSEQEMPFNVTRASPTRALFEYSSGFTVTAGMEFSGAYNPSIIRMRTVQFADFLRVAVGLPSVTEGKVEVEASTTNTWTWGKTDSYTTRYTAEFPVKAGPRSLSVRPAWSTRAFGRSFHHALELQEQRSEGSDVRHLARSLFVGYPLHRHGPQRD